MIHSIHRTARILEPAPHAIGSDEVRRLRERQTILEQVAASHDAREREHMRLLDYHADCRRAAEAELERIAERLDEFGGAA